MRSLLLILTVLLIGVANINATDAMLATQNVGTGFTQPVFVCAPSSDTTRLFVIEQHSGNIKIIHLADNSVTTFLTISAATTGRDVTQSGEQGLLGLAFHPQYATNGFFYVNYTTAGGGAAGQTVIERYKATAADLADPTSHSQILAFDQPEVNHNGGWIGFGADHFLYIAAGDGGGANDQHGTIGNAQDRNSLLGKLLRIDVDSAAPYAIPATNPFFGDTSKRGEIWAFGLRDPFRCSFDRSNGNLWVGDVGQGAREEVDFIPAGSGGLNFGWRPREGFIATAGITETPVTPATDPVYDYPHTNNNVAIIGGYVYRGSAIPGFKGNYIFGDYGGIHVWSFPATGTLVAATTDRTAEVSGQGTLGNISSFGEDAAGELYIVDFSHGAIVKIIPAATSPQSGVTVSALRGKVDFKDVGRDSVSISATVSAAAGFTPALKTFTLDIGGVGATFTLDKHGNARGALGSVSVKTRAGHPTLISARLKGNFAPSWVDEGIVAGALARNMPLTFAVTFTLGADVFTGTAAATYTASRNTSGQFKLTK